jgi:hypothetical protein
MKHTDEVLRLLEKQIGNKPEVDDIRDTAEEVVGCWVDPLTGGADSTNGLIYGLVQSGKTGVLTVTGAMGADEGYRTILVLTSDIDPLYEQTLARVREAFPGIDILGKTDFKDQRAFIGRVKSGTCALVATKNASVLKTLIENFKFGNLKGLSALIIDDEADQASLNTKAKKDDGTRSAINDCLVELRGFFQKNTYLQVTATPQALFLQTPDHDFRPKFTVLSHPGYAYVGGDDFFGDNSPLVREFSIDDIEVLAPGKQPAPTLTLPKSLQTALDMFMIGATFKRLHAADQNCAFLCHVSTRKDDHKHIVDLLRRYKDDLAAGLAGSKASVIARMEVAHADLAKTYTKLNDVPIGELLGAAQFYSRSMAVKLVNGETDEDVAVLSPYNLFVGGHKLGRGVTIKNLLVSYYGRHPKRPQADTVLQHARMYGYRRGDYGLLRLFLPNELHRVFKAIHKMERGLRELIERAPGEEFRGVYLEEGVKATRPSVIAPGAIGVYSGGATYNPAQVLRDASVAGATTVLDKKLERIGNRTFAVLSLDEIRALIELTRPDASVSENVWDTQAIAESITQFGNLRKVKRGYVYVDRDRGVKGPRRETQGVLTGGEVGEVPKDLLTVFWIRMKAEGRNGAAWWPQIRFPDGRYAFAFAV